MSAPWPYSAHPTPHTTAAGAHFAILSIFAVSFIIRAWKRDEGLDPEFHGSAGRFSVSEHEMGLIRGLMVSRPDTSCS